MKFNLLKIGILDVAIFLMLASCGGGSSESEPNPPFEPEIIDETITHEFSTSWTSDAKYHWHVALDNPNVISDKEEHKFSSWVEERAATELSPGSKKRECSVCHYEEYETIPVLQHEHNYDSKYSFDETHHWKEATCGHDLIIEKSAHQFVQSIIMNATFESPEIIRHSCVECDYFYDTSHGTLSHNYEDDYSFDEYTHWHACLDEGYENLKSENYVHVFSEWEINTEDDDEIVKSRKCLVCGYEETKVEQVVHTHTYNDTYSYDETFHWIGTTCGHDIKMNYYKHHFHKTMLTAPTYESEGEMHYECETCDYAYNETIPSLTHIYSDRWSFDEKYHYHKCVDVGFEDLYSDKDTHQLTEWFVDVNPGCDTSGHKYAFCDVCGYYVEEIIDPLGHTFDLNTWAYNNEEHYHPSTCGHDVTIDNENHDYDISVTVQPTYEKMGVRRYTCKVCGYHFDEYIPKLEHHYSDVWSSDETHHFHSCIDEDYEYLNIDKALHSYGDWTEVEKTTYEDGYHYRTCSICNYTQTEITDICDVHKAEKYLSFGIMETGSEQYAYIADAKEDLLSQDKITEIVIPKIHKFNDTLELPVRSIGSKAFSECNTLTSIIFPDTSFERIEEYAFKNCYKLTSLNVPSTVNFIGVAAFMGCSSLTSLSIPFAGASALNAANRSYMQSLFTDTERTKITQDWLPESLKNVTISNQSTLDSYAFWLCRSIENIHFVKEITNTSIEPYTFSGCSSLISIPSLPKLKYVREYAFRNCESLLTVDAPLISSVNQYAFYNCKSLENIHIENLTSISQYAFYNCSNLKVLTFNEKLKSIGTYAFYVCSNVEGIIFKTPLIDGVGIKAFASVNPTYMKFDVNPGGTVNQYLSSFYTLSKLKTLYIKSWSESICYLFAVKSDVVPSLPSSVEGIVISSTNVTGALGFVRNINVDTLEFDDNVEIVTGDVFYNTCSTNFKIIKIGKNVREIDTRFLSMNYYLTDIIVDPENPYFTVEDGILYNKDKTKILATINNYICDQETFYIDENVREIDDYALCGLRIMSYPTSKFYMKHFEVHPNNQYFATDGDALYTKDMKELIRVRSLYEGTFTIPSTVTRIRPFAFCECYYITNIEFPNSLTSIGSFAFNSMTRLETLTIPDSVTSVPGNVFSGNKFLTQVYLPSSLTYIDQKFFSDLISTVSITYGGTTANLLALFGASGITKDNCSFTITCSDGEVQL